MINRRNLLTLIATLPVGLGSKNGSAQQATPEPSSEWAHSEWFADPIWTQDHLSDETVRIVALTPLADFAAGHMPGASQIDWPDLALTDSAEATIETWQGVVTRQLADRSIAPGDSVVIYDGGTFYAARLWWILDLLGHADKRILNGGLPAWKAVEGELSTGVPVTGRAIEPYVATPDLTALANIDMVVSAVETQSAVLIDARTTDEFAEGHIPGAVNVPFIDNAKPESGGLWKSPAALREMYSAVGATTDQTIIPYCTTGVRSATTYFTLKVLDYPDVSLFSGSYAEWTSDPVRPVQTGTD